MADDAEIKAKFWKALKKDMTMFLGLAEGDDGHARPMTAQLDNDDAESGPLWFFTATDNKLFTQIGEGGAIGGTARDGAFRVKGSRCLGDGPRHAVDHARPRDDRPPVEPVRRRVV